jgi:hypothetical protein
LRAVDAHLGLLSLSPGRRRGEVRIGTSENPLEHRRLFEHAEPKKMAEMRVETLPPARTWRMEIRPFLALALLLAAAALYVLGASRALDRMSRPGSRERVVFVAFEIAPVAVVWVGSGVLGLLERFRAFSAGAAFGVAVYVGVGTVGGLLLDDVSGMHGPELAGAIAAFLATGILVAHRRDGGNASHV